MSFQRTNHATVVDDHGTLWVFGGEDEQSRLTNTLCSYSLDKQQWQRHNDKLEQIPIARAGHSLVAYDGGLFIFGGDGGPKKGRLNDLWRFDTTKHAFEQLNTANSIPKRMKHSAAVYNSFMFIFGGCDDQQYDTSDTTAESLHCLYVIDLQSQSTATASLRWHTIEIKGLPARVRHTLHVLHAVETADTLQLALLIICGEDKNGILENDMFVLHCTGNLQPTDESKQNDESKQQSEPTQTNGLFQCVSNAANWSAHKLQNVPLAFSPRFGHASVIMPFEDTTVQQQTTLRECIAFGGYSGEMDLLNDCWLISIQIDWKQNAFTLNDCKSLNIKNVPSPRHGHSLDTSKDGKLLLIYGGSNLEFETFNNMTIIPAVRKQWRQQKNAPTHTQASANEEQTQIIREQLQNMGFSHEQIENVIHIAPTIDQALAMLFG